MVSAILSRVVILVFGLLYPAYASYKAVKTKNVKEYVKWMMYWIVFALFCAAETFADVFLSWVPFYYEVKIIFVFWLLSPVTKGASFIYRKFVHPQLNKREKEIDEAIAQARTKGYSTLMTLGHKGLTYATHVVVNTAIKGQSTLVEQIKKSYSTNDLRVSDGRDNPDGDLPYIDDSEDEFGMLTQENTKANTQELTKKAALNEPIKEAALNQPCKDKNVLVEPSKVKSKGCVKAVGSRSGTKSESRLRADNHELEKRSKRDMEKQKLNRRPLARSKSDAADHRPRKARPQSGLSRLEEVEHETSMAHMDKNHSDNEETSESYTEEIIYYQPRKSHSYTSKERRPRREVKQSHSEQ